MTASLQEPTTGGAVQWPEFMSQRTAAAYLDLSPRTFRRLVDVEAMVIGDPRAPRGLRRYRRADLDAWAMRHLVRRRPVRGAA